MILAIHRLVIMEKRRSGNGLNRNLPLLTYHGTPIEELLEPQMREDFYHFEGNAQALRLVSKLHFLVDENGMNLTYALLNTIIKYPVASTKIHPEIREI